MASGSKSSRSTLCVCTSRVTFREAHSLISNCTETDSEGQSLLSDQLTLGMERKKKRDAVLDFALHIERSSPGRSVQRVRGHEELDVARDRRDFYRDAHGRGGREGHLEEEPNPGRRQDEPWLFISMLTNRDGKMIFVLGLAATNYVNPSIPKDQNKILQFSYVFFYGSFIFITIDSN